MRLSTQDILAGTRVVTVADREADIYVTAQQLGKEVLVRAIHNRQLARGKQHLWDVVEQAAVVGSMVIEVPRADDRPSRIATLELRIARDRSPGR